MKHIDWDVFTATAFGVACIIAGILALAELLNP